MDAIPGIQKLREAACPRGEDAGQAASLVFTLLSGVFLQQLNQPLFVVNWHAGFLRLSQL